MVLSINVSWWHSSESSAENWHQKLYDILVHSLCRHVPYFSDTSFWHESEQLKLKQHICIRNYSVVSFYHFFYMACCQLEIYSSLWHIFSHFHLDHCGALPYMSEMVGYEGKIYMTHPTKAICPIMLVSCSFISINLSFGYAHSSSHCHRFCRKSWFFCKV